MAKATIRTIAQEAGVSIATVSKALNDMPDVSDAVKVRIREIAQRQGYVINAAARQLASGQALNMGVIFPDLTRQNQASLYITLAQRLQRAGYALYFGNSDGDLRAEATMAADMAEKGAGLLLLMPATTETRHIEEAVHRKAPIVYLGGAVNPHAECSVKCDDFLGGMMAARVLRGGGCRRAAVFTWGLAATPQHERVRGFLADMQEYGVPVKVRQVSDQLTEEAGWRMAVQELREGPAEGIFATDDLLAVGALAAFRKNGLRVPEGVQVMGYGDEQISGLEMVRLSTIAQPSHELAICASDLAISLMRGQQDVVRKLTLEPVYVPRASTRGSRKL